MMTCGLAGINCGPECLHREGKSLQQDDPEMRGLGVMGRREKQSAQWRLENERAGMNNIQWRSVET